MPNGFSWEGEPTWGYAGPYTWEYATFESYTAPITVCYPPTGRCKTVMAENTHPEQGYGPCDQDVERAVIAALDEIRGLPVVWTKYLPYIAIGGIVITGLIVWLKKK
ncbi:hypothetical protein ES703_84154 [subsurface metagenome]